MHTTAKRRENLLRMVVVAVFCAMAYACQFVFRIHVSFLTFDAKDAIMAIGAMIFGPVWGVVMAFLVAFLEFLTLSGTVEKAGQEAVGAHRCLRRPQPHHASTTHFRLHGYAQKIL